MKWLMIDADYERLMRIEEGTYKVHMFELDSTASQDEYDLAAERDALDEMANQFNLGLDK